MSVACAAPEGHVGGAIQMSVPTPEAMLMSMRGHTDVSGLCSHVKAHGLCCHPGHVDVNSLCNHPRPC